MDKSILQQYMDACALVEETEADIRRLERSKDIVHDSVRGSMHEFPYITQTFRLCGTAEKPGDSVEMLEEIALLRERRKNAYQIKMDVNAYLNTLTPRAQRIIRYKIFDRLPWEKVAEKLGGNCTGDGVRMEFNRLMEEK